MIKYIVNVFTGTYAHWNDTNNAALILINSKIEKLAGNSADIFQRFLACSSITVDYLLGPDRKALPSSKISRKNIKSLTKEDFVNLHRDFIKVHAKLFSMKNRSQANKIKSLFTQIFREELDFSHIDKDGKELVQEIIFSGIKDAISQIDFLEKSKPLRDHVLFTSIAASHKQMFSV